MQTVTIDILNDKAEQLLQDLEHEQLIYVRKEKRRTPSIINWAAKYKDTFEDRPLNDSRVNEQRGGRK